MCLVVPDCEKDYVKYDSESLKTPKPVIPEDSNYFTEDHSYSFTELDTQYKPQSDLFEYNDENRRGNLYEDMAKPNRKANMFGVESSQEDAGFNYSDSTLGKFDFLKSWSSVEQYVKIFDTSQRFSSS